MKIISVVGARPNFMKIASFSRAITVFNQTAINSDYIHHILVHTGQHYDDRMSQTFFDELNIPEANINLGIGSGTHAEQIGYTMIEFEKVLINEKPDWVVVIGDVNATLACSVTGKKEWVKVCHIEAGLRSGDMTMPEEINRLVTDRLSDLLLTPDEISTQNLRLEGVPEKKIVFVGNIMIDTLETNRALAKELRIDLIINKNHINGVVFKKNVPQEEAYALITLHRPSNVDDKEVLSSIIRFLVTDVAKDVTIIWTIHPRTLKQLHMFQLFEEVFKHPNIILLEPLGYLEMLRLNMSAKIMLTDSGGLQEECTILGTPCLTLRWNTERPITLKDHGGASVLVGNNVNRIREEYKNAVKKSRSPIRPKLWDGKTAERCLNAILSFKV